jgi:hypothetical protein
MRCAGAKRGAAFESVEGGQHPRPGVLRDLLGQGATPQVDESEADQRFVMCLYQGPIRACIAREQPRDQVLLVGRLGSLASAARSTDVCPSEERHPARIAGRAGPVAGLRRKARQRR